MRPPVALPEALGKLGRNVEVGWTECSSEAFCPTSSWAGRTGTEASLETGDSASGSDNSAWGSASSWIWGRDSPVSVRDILGCRDFSGLTEVALDLLASLSVDLGTGICVDVRKLTGPSSSEGWMCVAETEGTSMRKD